MLKAQLDGEVDLQTYIDTLLQKEANISDDVLAVLRELGKCNKYLVLLVDDYDAALRPNPQYGEGAIEAF
ncbi:MAG: hypothetical protein HC771_22625 [Synechococcales cyanobacterium CRU_2_2]|nr:hypothetical protein [Synechococcales cyanobacterium CRU_2_2]